MTRSAHRRWVSALSVVAFLIAWEGASRLELVEPILVGSPTGMARAAARLLSSGMLLPDVAFTAGVFAAGFCIALATGALLGFAIGYSALAYDVLNPFIVAVSSVPKVVLMPLIVLWFGIGAPANVFLGALMGSFPILVSVYGGVRALDRDLVTLARAYRASRWLTLRAVVLPGITPFVLSGMRVAVSYVMVGTLIAELFASSRGVGHRMVLFMQSFRVEEFFVCVCLVALFTVGCTAAVHWLQGRVEAWRPPAARLPGM